MALTRISLLLFLYYIFFIYIPIFGRVNAIATGATIVLALLNIVVYNLRQIQEGNLPDESEMASKQQCRRFSLAKIRQATNNFDEALVIGRGGFGKVYKGVIGNGACSTVAIKRLDPSSKQGGVEFRTEIAMLSKFRHSHLVSLVGYCDDYDEMILVYEFMVRGTIGDHLHKQIGQDGNPPLSWVRRLEICVGAARGLEYLHTGTNVLHRVIHRDVKSSNILLDENWAAKVSDFGLSKICPINQSSTHVSTNVKGTCGYLDPQYLQTHKLTRKSDVYSFGVVLLEVLCGRPVIDSRLQWEQRNLVTWAKVCIKKGTTFRIIDPSLKWEILSDSLMKFVELADQCLHDRPKKRPTMAEVVARLEFALSLQLGTNSSILNEVIFSSTNGANRNEEKRNSFLKHMSKRFKVMGIALRMAGIIMGL